MVADPSPTSASSLRSQACISSPLKGRGNRARFTPRRRTRDNARKVATGDSRCGGARAGRACPAERERANIVANDGRGNARNRPFSPATAGGDGADSRPSHQTARDYAPPAQVRAPLAPAPAVGRQCGARHLSISIRNASNGSAEHRPSSGGERQSANAHRTRCGRAYNRYGTNCQEEAAL